jgi:alanyl-tRNA synthetase
MNTDDIRSAFLDFFEQRAHVSIDRARLILRGDPTTLFTGSGMQPMIPFLLGKQHSDGVRLANSQPCIRAQDIEEVGDNRHTTFFEMLGNWSLGDYFREQQVEWIFEFFDTVVGLDMNKVYVTCFIGAPEFSIGKDVEAGAVWKRLFEAKGLSSGEADIGTEEAGYLRGLREGERIFYYDDSKNWWSRNGGLSTTPIGDPCGPDSEMFYDFGTPHDPAYGEQCHPNCDCGRFMEIGNNVFMAYSKASASTFEVLASPNIDHGSGLERIAAARLSQEHGGDGDVYRIDLLWPIIETLQGLSGKDYNSNTHAMRVIADHVRGAVFLAVDGCVPGNKEQGYVMRRLLRRAISVSLDLGIEQNPLSGLVPVVANMYQHSYPEVADKQEAVAAVFAQEETLFQRTLKKGRAELARRGVGRDISGTDLFALYDTFGFPVELSTEETGNAGITLSADWKREFAAEMESQRARSRAGAKRAIPLE